MLRIRLARTGKKNSPSFRIVVAEHSNPVKSNFVEVVGFYNPVQTPKLLEFNEERIKYWISVGAKPSDTVASLLKNGGMSGMDDYIGRRDLARKKKNGEDEEEEVAAAPAPEAAPAPAAEEAPAEEKVEEPKEEPVAEEKAEEQKEEEPAKEEAPAEEAPAEEASEESADSKEQEAEAAAENKADA